MIVLFCMNVCCIYSMIGWCEGCVCIIDEIVVWSNVFDVLKQQIFDSLLVCCEIFVEQYVVFIVVVYYDMF